MQLSQGETESRDPQRTRGADNFGASGNRLTDGRSSCLASCSGLSVLGIAFWFVLYFGSIGVQAARGVYREDGDTFTRFMMYQDWESWQIGRDVRRQMWREFWHPSSRG